MFNPESVTKLIAAAQRAVAADYHEAGCAYKDHFEPLTRVHGSKQRAFHHARLLACAPACDCYLSHLTKALAAF